VKIGQHQWHQRIALAFAAGLLASLLTPRAKAQPPQYVTTVWQTEQGLPQNSVNAILQDHRGYLWVGTFGGLARFDGERFRVFDSGGIPGFGNNQILSLYESRSGVLWIGTEDGLIRLESGVATTYTERDGLPSRFIQSIRGDAEGNVWIKSSRGVAKFAGAKLGAYPSHRGKAVREFYLQARDGSMWFRCGTDLVRFGTDGSLATLKVRKPSVFLVQEARDGSVWVAVRDEYRLVRYYQGVFSDVPLPPIGRRALAEDPEYAVTMAEGADGELLLYTPAGLVRIEDGRLSPPEPLSLPANGSDLPKVRSLLVDREGALWVGMVGPGLLRLRPAPLTSYAKGEGLSDSSFNTVFQDREGRVWLGGDLLYWFDGHRFHSFPGVQDILAIAQTGDGDLWFGGYGGLYRWRSGLLSHFKVEAPAVGSIYQDREGTLWIGGSMEERPGGLFRFHEGKLQQIPGISGVQQITEGRDGGFWVAAIEGLFYVRGGKALLYAPNRSLPGHIVDIYQDSTGTLWLATYGGGLFRFRDGRLKAITTKDGLPNSMLLRILEDGTGNLWFTSTRNIFRLSLKELNDFADGRISSILPVSYGVAEGMRSSECNGGNPGVWKSRDGRIWFPTLRGVVAIDPAAGSRLPPPVVLEEAWANQSMLARDGQTSVRPGNNTFDFRFTALSFSAPEKLRFRYRLEPFDKNWVDAGTHRTAHYTNMAPGKYSFHVIAASDYGIWNEQGASVRFVLQPHFYQTNWFYALCAAMFLAMLWAAYQFRVHQLQTESKQLRDVIDTIPGSVWSALPNGSLDFINRRWLDFSGVSLEEALGRGWEAAVCPDDLAGFMDEWRAAVACGKMMESEARVRTADGQYRWLLIRSVPLHDKRGKIVKWYGTSTDIDDRKRAEETLREQADLLNLTHDTILVMTMEGVIKYWNRGAEEQYGWTVEEAVGREAHGLLKTVFPGPYEQIKMEVTRTGRWEGELVHTKKDETQVVVASRWSLQRGEQGAPVAILETNNDITERKRAEEALRRSNRELRALSNCNQILLRETDEQSLLQEICRIVCEEAGYRVAWVGYTEHDEAKSVRPAAWTGTEEGPLADLGISWADTERGRGLIGTAIRSGKTICIEDYATDPRVAPWRESALRHGFRSAIALPLKDERANAFGSLNIYSAQPNAFTPEEIRLLEELAADLAFGIVTLRSRAARERAEEALREGETRFRTFVDHAADSLFIYNFEQGTIVDVNRQACESLGYTRQELIGATAVAFHLDSDRALMESVAQRAADETAIDTHWHRRKDGTLFPVEVHTSQYCYGGRRFLLKVARDISDRLRVEEQRERLRQLEADLAHINRVSMMGELAASIAHEVNQPLSGVVSNGSACLRWLAGDVLNLEEAREAARRIVRDGKRAGEVIARVRALAKRAAAPSEKLDLNETIREVLALVGDEANRKSVNIRAQFADGLSPISGDRVQLQQVMLNLVMNAIEAMSSVGDRPRELRIITRNIDADQVQVTVKDSGAGIDPNTLDKIFDPFYTTKPGGMGMGLSISRSILQAHGGRLWVAAKDGPGTIFHFSLPKYHDEESNATS
jgi:PAS domain S-box-containing protein